MKVIFSDVLACRRLTQNPPTVTHDRHRIYTITCFTRCFHVIVAQGTQEVTYRSPPRYSSIHWPRSPPKRTGHVRTTRIMATPIIRAPTVRVVRSWAPLDVAAPQATAAAVRSGHGRAA